MIDKVDAMSRGDDRPSITQESPAADFEEFFRRHYREFGRIAYTLTNNRTDADEITGDAFAEIWNHWDRVCSADHPSAYARRIVVNLAALRVRKAMRERAATERAGSMARGFDTGPDIIVALDLQAAILLLPTGRRACVVLRHVMDMSEREVAQTLDVSIGTVKSQTSKGLSQLRALLDEAEGNSRYDRRAR